MFFSQKSGHHMVKRGTHTDQWYVVVTLWSTLWTDRQTDVTENMTFPQTLYVGGNEMSKINEWSQYRIPLKQSSPPKQALLASATKFSSLELVYCALFWGSKINVK